MKHRKHLLAGLVLAAVWSISSASAATPGAVAHEFEVTTTPADITGTSTGITTSFGGAATLTCTSSTLTGTVSEENPSSLTLTPEYKGCTSSFGGAAATITNEGCKTTFLPETTEDSHTQTQSAPVSMTCGGSGRIKMVTAGCTITFSDKSGEASVNQKLHGVKYKNIPNANPNEEHVTIESHLFTKHYVASGLCPLGGISNGTHTDGTTAGNWTVKAYEDGQPHDTAHQVGITVKGAPNE